MEEWISLKEFMNRNHIGYAVALKLLHSGKVQYEKTGSTYKIKVSNSEKDAIRMEALIRENEELKTTIKTMKNILQQANI